MMWTDILLSELYGTIFQTCGTFIPLSYVYLRTFTLLYSALFSYFGPIVSIG
ncbi:hypothetical protein BD408DRAFT_412067 [Parasitella parasitica]|nr:hypothetical protein BD408DRAFT_412067 [Parasitella parasitica]